MRSGVIELPTSAGTFGYVCQKGDCWTSRDGIYNSGSNATAYDFAFTESVIFASHNSERWRGYSLRCLSTVLDM